MDRGRSIWQESIKTVYSHIVANLIPPSVASVFTLFKCTPPVIVECQSLEFKCNWCEFQCATKIGLGVHQRSKHPNEFEGKKVTDRVKARWSEEELHVLAMKEIELPPNCRILTNAY